MFKQLILKKIYVVIIYLFYFSLAAAEDVFLSLKKSKVNVRYGPSFNFPIKYVYEKKNLPIKQIDKKENFRRIIDHKKNSGWIHVSQLKKINSVIAMKEKIIFKKSTIFSEPIVKVKKGRLLIIKRCEKNWCKVNSGKYQGWIDTRYLWGKIN